MSDLPAELAAITGSENLLTSRADRVSYSLAPFVGGEQPLPMAIARPGNTARLAALVKFCAEKKITMRARGAGTGFIIKAQARENDLVILFSGLNRIFQIDPASRAAHVQAGVTVAALAEAAAKHGLFWPPALAMPAIASIGGLLAQNCYSLASLKYGPASAFATALEIVDASGGNNIFPTQTGCPTGMDATPAMGSLFCGCGCALGFIASARLRLAPLPATSVTILACFENMDMAAKASAALMAATLAPIALEIFDETATPLLDEEATHCLLLARFAGADAMNEAAATRGIFADHGALSLREERRDGLFADFSENRAKLPFALKSGNAEILLKTASCPPDKLPALVEGIMQIAADKDIKVALFGHAGIARMHAAFFYKDAAAIAAASRDLFTLELALNHQLTSEEDMNIDAAEWRARQRNSLAEKIKKLLDPHNLLPDM